MYILNTNLKWFTIHPRNYTLNSVVWKWCLTHNSPPFTWEIHKRCINGLVYGPIPQGPITNPYRHTHTEMCVIPHSPLEACVSRSAQSKQCAQHFIRQLGLILIMFQRKDKKQNKAVKSLDHCLHEVWMNPTSWYDYAWEKNPFTIKRNDVFNCTSFDKNFTDKVNIKSALPSKLS